MPVWNGERYLAEAIESILTQTFQDFEFLILDDGSTDSTPEILTRFAKADSRIRVIPLNHEGIVVALNRGVSEAKSEWIARMDCDDIAHPRRFELQMAALTANPQAVLCHTGVRLIGDPAYMARQQRFPRSKAMVALRLCYQSPIVHPSVVFSKAAFAKAGSYRAEERHAEDYGLWGRLLPFGDFIGLPKPLLSFRIHQGSISKQKAETQLNLTRKIAIRHCQLFMSLNAVEAEKSHLAIISEKSDNGLRDWFWFLYKCLPRMKWQSLEIWAWAVKQSTSRIGKVG